MPNSLAALIVGPIEDGVDLSENRLSRDIGATQLRQCARDPPAPRPPGRSIEMISRCDADRRACDRQAGSIATLRASLNRWRGRSTGDHPVGRHPRSEPVVRANVDGRLPVALEGRGKANDRNHRILAMRRNTTGHRDCARPAVWFRYKRAVSGLRTARQYCGEVCDWDNLS
jgi:hypothetical protein